MGCALKPGHLPAAGAAFGDLGGERTCRVAALESRCDLDRRVAGTQPGHHPICVDYAEPGLPGVRSTLSLDQQLARPWSMEVFAAREVATVARSIGICRCGGVCGECGAVPAHAVHWRRPLSHGDDRGRHPGIRHAALAHIGLRGTAMAAARAGLWPGRMGGACATVPQAQLTFRNPFQNFFVAA